MIFMNIANNDINNNHKNTYNIIDGIKSITNGLLLFT